MLFFQVFLLGGYAYAHILTQTLRPRAQAIVHLTLLAAALALLPIVPSDSWKPHGTENPTLYILLLLTISLGLPYFVLSATGPLIQHWFLRANPDRSPYRLYALSNVGSLLALLTYPFYFESHFTRRTQATMWAWGLAAYALSCALCIKNLWSRNTQSINPSIHQSINPPIHQSINPSIHQSTNPLLDRLLWFLFPACASILLLATTNKICQDVAVIPFLWILPLALYLLTFIICFDSPRWYVRFPFTILLLAALAAIWWALDRGSDASIYKQLAAYCVGLFICAMVCHGELYRLRPDPSHLTAFYLTIAAGGAFGGVFVACLAPLLFKNYYELHCGILLCSLLMLIAWAREPIAYLRQLFGSAAVRQAHLARTSVATDAGVRSSSAAAISTNGESWKNSKAQIATKPAAVEDDRTPLPTSPPAPDDPLRRVPWLRSRALIAGLLLAASIALTASFWSQIRDVDNDKVHTSRNFYGVLTVFEHRRKEPNEHHFLLQHGRITHGLQFADPEESLWPTTYYGEESGVGLAMRALPPANRRIGLVGLGTGTLAAYGKAGDYLRIYEINREVKQLASTRFSYLSHSPAQIEIALGDARLSMEREPPQRLDLLVLDAFSGDAIPVHLLTREAFQIYQRHLNPNAIIAVHISNHYLDLEPVVSNLSRAFNYHLAIIDYDETEEEWWLYSSTWILLTRDPEILNSPAIQKASLPQKSRPRASLWTDDFTSLYQILK